jgi:prepilin-type N-terminal cleavage/methylation domain-containing protein
MNLRVIIFLKGQGNAARSRNPFRASTPSPGGEGRGEGGLIEGGRQSNHAFTLLELLVVITIIGLLAVIGLPAIKGMTKSNAIAGANRQLLDDISLARQLAIGNHTIVYMVFIPPDIATPANYPLTAVPYVQNLITNLYTGQYTTYALLSLRSVGDQPGASSARYLTPWKTLPGGVYIATNKYPIPPAVGIPQPAPAFTNDISFPFPVATNLPVGNVYRLPYIAFNYLGQLTTGQGAAATQKLTSEYIPLVRGSILYNGTTADVAEAHPGDAYYNFTIQNVNAMANNKPIDTGNFYNQIYIDSLTGRARVQHLEVQ